MTANTSIPHIETGGNIGYTQGDRFKVFFNKPGSLKNYTDADIFISCSLEAKMICGGTIKAYLTSASTLTDMTDANSTQIMAETDILGCGSTSWDDVKPLSVKLDMTNVKEGQENLVFEVTKTADAVFAGNYHKVVFSKTPEPAPPAVSPSAAPSTPSAAPSTPSAAPSASADPSASTARRHLLIRQRCRKRLLRLA